jgi:cold shock CspA family protein
LTTLPEGSRLSYAVQPGRYGKMSAGNLRLK